MAIWGWIPLLTNDSQGSVVVRSLSYNLARWMGSWTMIQLVLLVEITARKIEIRWTQHNSSCIFYVKFLVETNDHKLGDSLPFLWKRWIQWTDSRTALEMFKTQQKPSNSGTPKIGQHWCYAPKWRDTQKVKSQQKMKTLLQHFPLFSSKS